MENPVYVPFYVRENRLTDGSMLWEVYQKGSGQRLASSSDENEANILVNTLNMTVSFWAVTRASDNTVDAPP